MDPDRYNMTDRFGRRNAIAGLESLVETFTESPASTMGAHRSIDKASTNIEQSNTKQPDNPKRRKTDTAQMKSKSSASKADPKSSALQAVSKSSISQGKPSALESPHVSLSLSDLSTQEASPRRKARHAVLSRARRNAIVPGAFKAGQDSRQSQPNQHKESKIVALKMPSNHRFSPDDNTAITATPGTPAEGARRSTAGLTSQQHDSAAFGSNTSGLSRPLSTDARGASAGPSMQARIGVLENRTAELRKALAATSGSVWAPASATSTQTSTASRSPGAARSFATAYSQRSEGVTPSPTRAVFAATGTSHISTNYPKSLPFPPKPANSSLPHRPKAVEKPLFDIEDPQEEEKKVQRYVVQLERTGLRELAPVTLKRKHPIPVDEQIPGYYVSWRDIFDPGLERENKKPRVEAHSLLYDSVQQRWRVFSQDWDDESERAEGNYGEDDDLDNGRRGAWVTRIDGGRYGDYDDYGYSSESPEW